MTAVPQHLQALSLANEIRFGVYAFVRETRALPRREAANVLADVFERDHEDRILGAARVRVLLTAAPRLSRTQIERLLRLASCASKVDVRLRDLTKRQRTVIACQLRLWAEGGALVGRYEMEGMMGGGS